MDLRMLEFFGNGTFLALNGDFIIKPGNPRVVAFTPNLSGHTVTLPDTVNLRLGGPHLYLVNLSGVNSFEVESTNQIDNFTVAADKALVLSVFRGNGQSRWFGQIRDFAGTAVGALAP